MSKEHETEIEAQPAERRVRTRGAEALHALRAEVQLLRSEVAEWRKLRDPVTLHVSLLRGVPARLDRATFLHLAGDDVGPWLEDAQDLIAVGSQVERGVGPHRADVAALYVEPKGCYVGVQGVDPWDEARDARTYAGPHPVVAHPPCQRWGRFWHGSTRKPHQYELGADGGCFAAALDAVRKWGGVIEHPADSKAWDAFGLPKPRRSGGWEPVPTRPREWVCCVYQGHYGHMSGKATWLYAAGVYFSDLPVLKWGKTEQRLPEWMIERYGYEKARRIGVVAMVGGKNKTRIRNATPPEFRDLLLALARRCQVRPNV